MVETNILQVEPMPKNDQNLIQIGENQTHSLENVKDGWYPSNGTDGRGILGEIDAVFLVVYSMCMYFCGTSQ